MHYIYTNIIIKFSFLLKSNRKDVCFAFTLYLNFYWTPELVTALYWEATQRAY